MLSGLGGPASVPESYRKTNKCQIWQKNLSVTIMWSDIIFHSVGQKKKEKKKKPQHASGTVDMT